MTTRIVLYLAEALRQQARNYHIWLKDRTPLCWCRFEDFTLNPQCEDQPQCTAARAALAAAQLSDDAEPEADG